MKLASFYQALVPFAALAYTSATFAIGDTPETLDEMYNKEISQDVVDTVFDALPEGVVNADYINPNYDGYLQVLEGTTVSVSFINEGAGFRNSTGYFTFTDNSFDGLNKSSIDTNSNGTVSLTELKNVSGVDFGWLFPNTSAELSGGVLQRGDTIDVNFDQSSNLGFFLAPNAWNGNTVQGGIIQGNAGLVYYSLDFLNPESYKTADMLGSVDAPDWVPDSLGYSDDGAFTHTAMILTDTGNSDVVLGFEDLQWGGDKDYNDAVFLVTASLPDGFGGSNIATAPVPTLSGGLFGLLGTIGVLMGGRRRKA